MAWHHRHVVPPHPNTAAGGLRTSVVFVRRDLLYAPDEPIQNPYAKGTLRIPLKGEDSKHRFRQVYIGPNVADLVVRKVEEEGQVKPRVVWRLRHPDEFFVEPENRKTQGSEEHPFRKRLCTGGTFLGYADGFIEVEKRSSVSVSTQVYRLAIGMKGSFDAASRHIGEIATRAWDRDVERARGLYDLVAGKGEVLDEDVPRELKAASTVSQEVEYEILRQVCTWLGVDPDLPIKRKRGRPADKKTDEDPDDSEVMAGEIIELILTPDDSEAGHSVTGRILKDFVGVKKGTLLASLLLTRLAALLVALRDAELTDDADLLEAYLEAVNPDWQEELAEEVGVPQGNGLPDDPWSLLGVTRDADEEEIKRAYRKVMRAVHPDASGLPDWISQIVVKAHGQIMEEMNHG